MASFQLPSLGYTQGVGSFAKPDIAAPIRTSQAKQQLITAEAELEMTKIAGRAAEKAAIAGVVGQVGDEVFQYAVRQEERKRKMQTEERYNKVTTTHNDWKRMMSTKEFFSTEELPAEMQADFMESTTENGEVVNNLRTDIPKHEVYTTWEQIEIAANVEATEGMQDSMRDREYTTSQLKVIGDKQFTTSTINMNAKRRKYNRLKQTNLIFDYADQGEYDAAFSLVESFDGTAVEKKKFRDDLHRVMELDQYDMSIMELDVPRMKEQVKYLSSANKDYDGTLVMDERRIQKSALESAIFSTQKRDTDAIAQYKKNIKWKTRRMIGVLEDGGTLEPENVNSLLTQVQDIDAELAIELIEAVDTAPEVKRFIVLPEEVRELILSGERQDVMSVSSHIQREALQTAHENTIVRQNKNNLSFGNETGMIRLDPIDYENLVSSFSIRYNQADLMETQTHKPTAFLTDPEAVVETARFKKLTTPEKVAYAANVKAAFGDFSAKYWEQIKQQPDGGALAIAGELFSSGPAQGRAAAQTILTGRNVLEEKPKILGETGKVVAHIYDKLGKTYSATQGHTAALIDSVKASYAYYLDEAKEYEGVINVGLLDKAIADVTGGIIKYNGASLEVPVWGMDKGTFKDTIRRIRPEQIDALGGVSKYTNLQFLRAIDKGDLKLIQAAKGSYYVADPKTGEIVHKKKLVTTGLARFGESPRAFVLDLPSIIPGIMSQESYEMRAKAEWRKRLVMPFSREDRGFRYK